MKNKIKIGRNFLIIIFLLIISLILTDIIHFFIHSESRQVFIKTLPNVLSGLLAGTIAALAIIFSLSNELKFFFKTEYNLLKNKDKDPNNIEDHRYIKFLKKLKQDAKFIFFSLIISLIALIFIKISFLIKIKWLSFNIDISLILSIISILISLGSVYDIINSLFTINELRYCIQKEVIREEE